MCVISAILFEICRNTGWVHESSSYVWRDTKMFQSITLVWLCHPSQTTHKKLHFHSNLWWTRSLIWVAHDFKIKSRDFYKRVSTTSWRPKAHSQQNWGMLCFWRKSLRALAIKCIHNLSICSPCHHIFKFENNSLKVFLTEPNVTNGVQIPN